MTVKELKDKLADVPDDAEVLVTRKRRVSDGGGHFDELEESESLKEVTIIDRQVWIG